VWQAREIDLAADHGIDVMLFDWYWYSGVRIMQETLENAFLLAPNRSRLKFALMWANHTWADYFPPPFGKPMNVWLPIRHSEMDMWRVLDYWIEHYFSQPNYWRPNGRLFLSIYRPLHLIGELGGVRAFRTLADKIDRRLDQNGLPPLHWQGMDPSPNEVPLLHEAGFHSTSSYNIHSSGRVSEDFTEDYCDLIDEHQRVWRQMAATAVPYDPVITVGWDVTPRCQHDLPWPYPLEPEAANPLGLAGERRYPHTPVVVGNTPERFGRLCGLARDYALGHRSPADAVFINAWNEWTEGCYLLPESRTGLGYLEAVKQAFATNSQIFVPSNAELPADSHVTEDKICIKDSH
jgi:hypothetical protein